MLIHVMHGGFLLVSMLNCYVIVLQLLCMVPIENSDGECVLRTNLHHYQLRIGFFGGWTEQKQSTKCFKLKRRFNCYVYAHWRVAQMLITTQISFLKTSDFLACKSANCPLTLHKGMNQAKETVVSATVRYFHCTQLFVSKPKLSTDYKHMEPWKQGL